MIAPGATVGPGYCVTTEFPDEPRRKYRGYYTWANLPECWKILVRRADGRVHIVADLGQVKYTVTDAPF